ALADTGNRDGARARERGPRGSAREPAGRAQPIGGSALAVCSLVVGSRALPWAGVPCAAATVAVRTIGLAGGLGGGLFARASLGGCALGRCALGRCALRCGDSRGTDYWIGWRLGCGPAC